MTKKALGPRKTRKSSRRRKNPAYSVYKQNCRRKNIYFDLSKELVQKITALPCHYCGRPPSNCYGGQIYSGMDRVDNNKGYYIGNVVPCCYQCNRVKSNNVSYAQMKRLGKVLRGFWEKPKRKG